MDHKQQQRSGIQQQQRVGVQCFICKKYGHTKAQCWYNEANYVEETKESEEEEEGLLLMASQNSNREMVGTVEDVIEVNLLAKGMEMQN